MGAEELNAMLADVERIERFVEGQMVIPPTEMKEKADAAEAVRNLKKGVETLMEAYKGKKAAIQGIIDKRRAS